MGSKKSKSIKKKIHNLKIGKIGSHPDGFDTCKYNQKKLMGLCGIKVDEIDIDTFLNNSRNVKSEDCLLYTSPSPRDRQKARMPSSA